MKKFIFIALAYLLISNTAISQDSLKLSSEVSLELKGKHILSALNNDLTCISCARGSVRDNPIHHFAIYTGINHKLTINDKYGFTTGLYLEERSFSGGNTTLSNLVIYPKIFATAQDTFTLFNKKIYSSIKGGDFWNEDIGDIIRFYNIDYQALKVDLGWNKWSVGLMIIGDLSKNIGLGLHELYRYNLTYNSERVKNIFTVNFNQLSIKGFSDHVLPKDRNLANYTKYKLSNIVDLEQQVELRLNKTLGQSLAAAFKLNVKVKKLNFNTAIKYFDTNFNAGYFNRFSAPFTNGQEYVGFALYPLKNYYRANSQWSNYTKEIGSDLLGLEIGFIWEKAFSRKWSFVSDIEYLLIGDITNENLINVPFYDVGIQHNFLKILAGKFSITNKHMDIFTNYQTHAASKHPFMSYAIQLDLDEMKLGIRRFKY
jgi:hypothetical protein